MGGDEGTWVAATSSPALPDVTLSSSCFRVNLFCIQVEPRSIHSSPPYCLEGPET
jgi:hypothetical protein